MKRFIYIVCCVFLSVMPALADIRPYSVNDINPNSLGVYQAENKINIYAEPNLNSDLIYSISWNEKGLDSNSVYAGDVFVAFYPKKNLGFLTVMDESEDMEWLQVLYQKNKLGWIKKEDPYRYSNWRNFFNDYGRKYGLSYLKGTPDNCKNLYGSPDDDAKLISSVTLAKAMKLTSVSGNWILAIIYDIDHSQKIGYLKWRSNNGEIFLFPSIK